jgi:hypothetical protein
MRIRCLQVLIAFAVLACAMYAYANDSVARVSAGGITLLKSDSIVKIHTDTETSRLAKG